MQLNDKERLDRLEWENRLLKEDISKLESEIKDINNYIEKTEVIKAVKPNYTVRIAEENVHGRELIRIYYDTDEQVKIYLKND